MTVLETALYLGVSPQRVRALINNGKLPAQKHGRDWWLKASDVKAFKAQERPAHRPRKS